MARGAHPPPSVEDLVAAARAGETDAWEALVERYGGLVVGVARSEGLSEADVDEVVQETWSALVAQIERVESPRALPRWITITARRQAWRLRRRDTSGGPASPDGEPPEVADPADGPRESLVRLETRQRVRDRLDELDPRCRELLRRLYFEGEPAGYGEIGRALGMPSGSVGPTRLRCLAKLARLLERDRFPGAMR